MYITAVPYRQLRPYDRIMYLLFIPTLMWMKGRGVSWNGMMDFLAEGLEHGMRWIKHRFAHCNKLRDCTVRGTPSAFSTLLQ